MKLNIIAIEGGLGNQMFQYAFFLSLKYDYFPNDLNRIYIAPYRFHNGYEMDKVFGVKQSYITNLFVGFVKKYLKRIVLKKKEKIIICL